MLINIENINFTKHPLFATGSDMQELSAPLLQFGITHFSYTRLDQDGGCVHLTNRPDFSEFFVQRKFYRRYFCSRYDAYQTGVFLADFMNFDVDFMAALRDKNLGHILMLVRRHLEFTEIFYFGVPIGFSYMNQFYVNHLDFFENFCLDFKNKAMPLLQSYASQRLVYGVAVDQSGLVDQQLLRKIFVSTDIDEMDLLTQREYECMGYVQKGFTAKMIAQELDISYRTVEHHLAHIRRKLGLKFLKSFLS